LSFQKRPNGQGKSNKLAFSLNELNELRAGFEKVFKA